MEFLSNFFKEIIVALLSTFASYFLTNFFNKKELSKEKEKWEVDRKLLLDEIKKHNINNEIVWKQEMIDKCIAEWKISGTPHTFLKNPDIPNTKKSEIFISASMRYKNKPPKNNPYG